MLQPVPAWPGEDQVIYQSVRAAGLSQCYSVSVQSSELIHNMQTQVTTINTSLH